MLRKIILLSVLVLGGVLFTHQAYALSDVEYNQMMEDDNFNYVEKELTNTWKKIIKLVDKNSKENLLESQRKWVSKDRDINAKLLMSAKKYSKIQAYTQVTSARNTILNKLIYQINNPNSKVSFNSEIVSYNNGSDIVYLLNIEDVPTVLIGRHNQFDKDTQNKLYNAAKDNNKIVVSGYLYNDVSLDSSKEIYIENNGYNIHTPLDAKTTQEITLPQSELCACLEELVFGRKRGIDCNRDINYLYNFLGRYYGNDTIMSEDMLSHIITKDITMCYKNDMIEKHFYSKNEFYVDIKHIDGIAEGIILSIKKYFNEIKEKEEKMALNNKIKFYFNYIQSNFLKEEQILEIKNMDSYELDILSVDKARKNIAEMNEYITIIDNCNDSHDSLIKLKEINKHSYGRANLYTPSESLVTIIGENDFIKYKNFINNLKNQYNLLSKEFSEKIHERMSSMEKNINKRECDKILSDNNIKGEELNFILVSGAGFTLGEFICDSIRTNSFINYNESGFFSKYDKLELNINYEPITLFLDKGYVNGTSPTVAINNAKGNIKYVKEVIARGEKQIFNGYFEATPIMRQIVFTLRIMATENQKF